MLNWNTLTTIHKNKKRECETKYGLTHSLANSFQEPLQKHFFNWYKIFPKKPKASQIHQPKINYSCMNNMSKIIKRHNKKVRSKPCDQRPKYDCLKNAQCSIEKNCLVNDVAYKCDVTRPFSKIWVFSTSRGRME